MSIVEHQSSTREPESLITKAAERDDEVRMAHDLMAKSHTPNYYRASEWFETCGLGYPGFRREHTRIALWKGELAGALRITTDTVRLGEARLKMGGLGWVTTEPRHRHKGVCSALMRHTLRYMKEHGYHVSMLFGIPNFYHRFGYTTVLPEHTVSVDAIEAHSSGEPKMRVRTIKPGDIPAMQRIHSENDAEVPCSLLRSRAHFSNKWDLFRKARVLTTEQGKVEGYVVARTTRDDIRVEEMGGSSPAVFQDILAVCASIAHDEFRGRIRFSVPPGHPFSHYLLRYASTRETQVVREEGGMMAFIDLGETLENLIPEWESMLAHSIWRDRRVEMTLVVDGQPFRLRANHGVVDVAEFTGRNKFSLTSAELMQLVTGYRYLNDILEEERRILTSEARELLAVLFPKRDPFVWPLDRF